MDILNTFALESNKQFKISFTEGDLSSDAGLLLVKEFAAKTGFEDLVRKNFKTNDYAIFRHHTVIPQFPVPPDCRSASN